MADFFDSKFPGNVLSFVTLLVNVLLIVFAQTCTENNEQCTFPNHYSRLGYGFGSWYPAIRVVGIVHLVCSISTFLIWILAEGPEYMPREASWQESGEGGTETLGGLGRGNTKSSSQELGSAERSSILSRERRNLRAPPKKIIKKSASQSRIKSAMAVQHQRVMGRMILDNNNDIRSRALMSKKGLDRISAKKAVVSLILHLLCV